MEAPPQLRGPPPSFRQSSSDKHLQLQCRPWAHSVSFHSYARLFSLLFLCVLNTPSLSFSLPFSPFLSPILFCPFTFPPFLTPPLLLFFPFSLFFCPFSHPFSLFLSPSHTFSISFSRTYKVLNVCWIWIEQKSGGIPSYSQSGLVETSPGTQAMVFLPQPYSLRSRV